MLFLFSACQTAPPTLLETVSPNSAALSSEQVQIFVLQKLKQNGHSPVQSPKWFPDWYGKPSLSGLGKTPELNIQDVWFNGQSIQGPQAPNSLRSDWEGSPVEIVIKGKFEDKKDRDLNLTAFRFTLEPSVQIRAMAPNETQPASRILLDDAILLTPLSVSAIEIRVSLPQAGLGELLS